MPETLGELMQEGPNSYLEKTHRYSLNNVLLFIKLILENNYLKYGTKGIFYGHEPLHESEQLKEILLSKDHHKIRNHMEGSNYHTFTIANVLKYAIQNMDLLDLNTLAIREARDLFVVKIRCGNENTHKTFMKFIRALEAIDQRIIKVLHNFFYIGHMLESASDLNGLTLERMSNSFSAILLESLCLKGLLVDEEGPKGMLLELKLFAKIIYNVFLSEDRIIREPLIITEIKNEVDEKHEVGDNPENEFCEDSLLQTLSGLSIRKKNSVEDDPLYFEQKYTKYLNQGANVLTHKIKRLTKKCDQLWNDLNINQNPELAEKLSSLLRETNPENPDLDETSQLAFYIMTAKTMICYLENAKNAQLSNKAMLLKLTESEARSMSEQTPKSKGAVSSERRF